MNTPLRRTLTVRLSGELSTKAKGTRNRFQWRLVSNIRDALERNGIEHSIEDKWFRIDITTEDPAAVEIVSRQFGVQGVSFGVTYAWNSIEDIVSIGFALHSSKVAGKSFAVRSKRVGPRDKNASDSRAIDRALGAKLVTSGGQVLLDDPEYVVALEVRENEVTFFQRVQSGPGGLPTGVEGRALSLISGGFDSAVSSWLMMRRGVDLDYLFFNLAGNEHVRQVFRTTQRLTSRWAFGHRPLLNVVDLRPVVAEFKSNLPSNLWQLALKRTMYRTAELHRQHTGRHQAIITGEAIGQVSTQTLTNLTNLQSGLNAPILRPLVSFNKNEIIARAVEIETHRLGESVPEFCDLKAPRSVSSCTLDDIESIDALVSDALLQELVENRRVFKQNEIDEERLRDIRVSSIPEGALVLDLREEQTFDRKHHDGAVRLDFMTALDQVHLLPKTTQYVVVCDVGLKSAYIAELMNNLGYDALSLSGGYH